MSIPPAGHSLFNDLPQAPRAFAPRLVRMIPSFEGWQARPTMFPRPASVSAHERLEHATWLAEGLVTWGARLESILPARLLAGTWLSLAFKAGDIIPTEDIPNEECPTGRLHHTASMKTDLRPIRGDVHLALAQTAHTARLLGPERLRGAPAWSDRSLAVADLPLWVATGAVGTEFFRCRCRRRGTRTALEAVMARCVLMRALEGAEVGPDTAIALTTLSRNEHALPQAEQPGSQRAWAEAGERIHALLAEATPPTDANETPPSGPRQ